MIKVISGHSERIGITGDGSASATAKRRAWRIADDIVTATLIFPDDRVARLNGDVLGTECKIAVIDVRDGGGHQVRQSGHGDQREGKFFVKHFHMLQVRDALRKFVPNAGNKFFLRASQS